MADRLLKPIHANLGLGLAYRQRLDKAIAEMQRSVSYWVLAKYRQNQPELMALDASPAMEMRRTMRKLSRRWIQNFDDLAPKLADYFATSVEERSTAALQAALRDGGMSVRFKMTRPVNDAYQAVIGENVGLIRSIAQEHLSAIEGEVMRSVQQGRKLDQLATILEDRYGVTKRRAALISRDQNNKATAVITRARQLDLGITEAIWMHSAGGKKPRPSHVALNGQTYDIRKGAWDPDEGQWIFPGELINCRCVQRAKIPGFD